MMCRHVIFPLILQYTLAHTSIPQLKTKFSNTYQTWEAPTPLISSYHWTSTPLLELPHTSVESWHHRTGSSLSVKVWAMKLNSFFHSSSNVWAPKRVLAGDGSLVADSFVGICLMKDSETLGVKLKSKNTKTLGFKYVLMIMTITFKEKKIKKKIDTKVGL